MDEGKVKVKAAQSCPTLWDLTDYTVHGILQARILEWVAFPFSRRSSQPQGWNPGLPHSRQILYQLTHQGSPRTLERVACPFSSGSSRPRNWTGVSCMAGGFFTNWATRAAPCMSEELNIQRCLSRFFITPMFLPLPPKYPTILPTKQGYVARICVPTLVLPQEDGGPTSILQAMESFTDWQDSSKSFASHNNSRLLFPNDHRTLSQKLFQVKWH